MQRRYYFINIHLWFDKNRLAVNDCLERPKKSNGFVWRKESLQSTFLVFALKEKFGQLMICEDFNLLIRCVETSCNTDRKRFARVCRKQWSIPPFNIVISQWWRPYWTTRTLHSVIIITGRHERHFLWFRKPTWRRRKNAG